MALRRLWRRLMSPSLPARLSRQVAWKLAGLATWLPVIATVKIHVVDFAVVNGPSMYPVLNGEKDATVLRDWTLNWKWRAQENLKKGMIVTFWSPPHPNTVSIKRIVALEGETVTTKPPYPSPTAVVPASHVWVEGDGPPGSTMDSNTYGPVSKRLIIGQVKYVVYPFWKAGPISPRDPHRVT